MTQIPRQKSKIASAYFSNLSSAFSGLLTNLWLLRKITQLVPSDEFGIYALVLQIVAYLSLIQLGIDFAASRDIAKNIGQGDLAGARESYDAVSLFNRRLAVYVLVGALILTLGLYSGVGVPQNRRALASLLAGLAGCAQLVAFLQRPYSAALIGSQRQATVNIITATRTTLTTVVAYALVTNGVGVKAIPVAELGMHILALLTLVLFFRGLPLAKQPATKTNRSRKSRELLRFGGLVTLGGLAWTIESTADAVILAYWLGPGAVAAYVLWWRFPQMLFDLCSRLSTSSFPELARAKGESVQLAQQLFGKLAYITVGLATLAFVGISIWLPSFMSIWLNSRYQLPNFEGIARAMGALVFLRVIGNQFATAWLATTDAVLTTRLSVMQAVLKVTLALAVGRFGILPLLCASCVSASVQVLVIGFHLIKRGQLTYRYLYHSTLLTTVASISTILSGRLQTTHLPVLALGISLTICVWSILWLAIIRQAGISLLPAKWIAPLRARLATSA